MPVDRTLADPLVGSVLEGRYRIRGRIARGGMATVYDALDERLERTVAVKIMHPGYAADPSFVTRFIGEARSAAALSHPSVVAVYDQGVHEGLAFLVMEQVPGRTLREVLVSRGRLPAAEALAILDPVLDALAAAHRHGMVHRDVKPENVLIGSDGRSVKVADFGLARAVAQVGPTSTRGVVMGTVAYVSPEQITYGQASTRSDVYSAGIMLFEMLTGSVPYGGDSSVNIAFQHVHADVPPPSSRTPLVPPALDELATRATRRDPNLRPVDAGAFLDELRAVRDEIEGRSFRTTGPAISAIPAPQHSPAPQSGPLTPTASASVRVPPMPGQHTQVVPPIHGTAMMPGGMLPPPPGGRLGHHAAPGGGPLGRFDPKQRKLALLACVVVLALIAAGTGWYLGVGRYTSAPTLTHLSQADATARAKAAGLRIAVVQKFDDNEIMGRVFKQSPGPSERIRKGGTVTAIISKGPDRVTVPNIKGLDQGQATAALSKAGLNPKVTTDFDDDTPTGHVISSSPDSKAKVKGGTTVNVLVSKGKGVSLPDLQGKSREEAEQTLQELGLVVNTEIDNSNTDQSKAGTVLDQDPKGGGKVASGTVVKLTVAQGQSQVQVPDVGGQRFNDAKQILEGAGLQVKRRGGGDSDDSRVLFQFPSAGTTVAANTQITVFTG
jgi:serine/threonine-protein kinase